MPLFYLHTRRDGSLVDDPDGSNVAGLGEARDEAIAAARELWSCAIARGEDLSDRQFVIADERGGHVLTIPFTDALPEGLRRHIALS